MIYSKRILSLISVLMVVAGCFAAEPGDTLTARRVFASAPLEVLDMLRPTTRLDMLDYYTQADSILNATDALGGSSHIETMTDDYMRLAVSPVSTLEIKILPFRKSQIAMTIYTVGSDSIARDSQVRFYDSQLQPLPEDMFIRKPDVKSFFNLKNSDISASDIVEWLPFQTMEYSTGPGQTPLTISLTTLRILPNETREKLEKIVSPRTVVWNGSKFK